MEIYSLWHSERLESEVVKSLVLEPEILASSPGFATCQVTLGMCLKFSKPKFLYYKVALIGFFKII